MAHDRLEFGSVLEGKGSGDKLWLLIIPAILAVFAIAGYGMMKVSKVGSLERDAEAARAQAAELQKTVEERDKLLVDARAEEAIQRSPGVAVALFYGLNARAQESGVAFAHPSENAARVYFYGLTVPPEGLEYVVAARTKGGSAKALGSVVPGNDGTGFLLARDVPEGTTAIELLLTPRGQENLDAAEPRASARYPANGERGVLTEVRPATQARRGRATRG
jgi:hypothetical protein